MHRARRPHHRLAKPALAGFVLIAVDSLRMLEFAKERGRQHNRADRPVLLVVRGSGHAARMIRSGVGRSRMTIGGGVEVARSTERDPWCPGATAFESGVGFDSVAASLCER
jgi:hypothetical protein